MKTIYAAVPLAAAMLLAGCKGFWDPLPSSGGGGTTATMLSSGPFYVLNQGTGQIVAYNISSGSLKTIGTYNITAPVAIAIAPNKDFLYVSTKTDGIFVYNIGNGGALTLGNNGHAISPDLNAAIQVDTTNSWLIDAFLVNPTGPVLLNATPLNSNGTNVANASIPQTIINVSNPTVKQLLLSPKGDYLFLALGTAGAAAVSFDSGNSSPFVATTTIGVSNSNQGILSVAVDPHEHIFYLGETSAFSTGTTGGLLAYNYSSLTNPPLTQISGSPIASGGTSPSAILAEASGDFVYVANGNGTSGAGNISWFPITATGSTYSIAVGSNVASGVFPISLAEDNLNSFVLAVSQYGNHDLVAYTMSSGALTSAISTNTGNDPVTAVAVAALPQ